MTSAIIAHDYPFFSKAISSLLLSSDLPLFTSPSKSNETLARRKKAIGQQYLTPQEEKALVVYILRCAANSFPLLVKALRRLVLVIKQYCTFVYLTKSSDSIVHSSSKNYL